MLYEACCNECNLFCPDVLRRSLKALVCASSAFLPWLSAMSDLEPISTMLFDAPPRLSELLWDGRRPIRFKERHYLALAAHCTLVSPVLQQLLEACHREGLVSFKEMRTGTVVVTRFRSTLGTRVNLGCCNSASRVEASTYAFA